MNQPDLIYEQFHRLNDTKVSNKTIFVMAKLFILLLFFFVIVLEIGFKFFIFICIFFLNYYIICTNTHTYTLLASKSDQIHKILLWHPISWDKH